MKSLRMWYSHSSSARCKNLPIKINQCNGISLVFRKSEPKECTVQMGLKQRNLGVFGNLSLSLSLYMTTFLVSSAVFVQLKILATLIFKQSIFV